MSIQFGSHTRTFAHASRPIRSLDPAVIGLLLRVGLGLVILSGGWAKLLQLLDSARADAFVANYLSAGGYINPFFSTYLFEGTVGTVITPWLFLTGLSTLELVCGIALILGLLVRPQALLWGVMFWTFLAALPVVTANGAVSMAPTHTTPALLVLIRDLGLSGMFFVLFNIGAGRYSLDERLFGPGATRSVVNWDDLALLLRVSVALPLLVGGAFGGLSHIQTFSTPPAVLFPLALLLLGGVGVRAAGGAVTAIMLWHLLHLLGPASSIIALMNAFKREFAFVAAAVVLTAAGGGQRFRVTRMREGLQRLLRPGSATGAGQRNPAAASLTSQ